MIAPYYDQDGITIFCGDCREVVPGLTGIDITITDPPYNVGMPYTSGDQRSDYEQWCAEWFALMPRPLIFTPGTVNLWMWFRIASPDWVGVWYKPNATSRSRIGGWNVWEPVLMYGTPRRRIAHDAWSGLTWNNKQTDTGDHPCPKSPAFMRMLVEKCSRPNDVICDPFAGTGTTLLAAKAHGRRAIGIELEERYCEIAVRRLRQATLPLEAPA